MPRTYAFSSLFSKCHSGTFLVRGYAHPDLIVVLFLIIDHRMSDRTNFVSVAGFAKSVPVQAKPIPVYLYTFTLTSIGYLF